jgi:hypothetical protein
MGSKANGDSAPLAGLVESKQVSDGQIILNGDMLAFL